MFDRRSPLRTLRAFASAGRHLSMTLAAQELHLTHGVVSRQLKSLEEFLGVPLFHRLTHRMVLTDEGAEFLVAVTRLPGNLTREADRIKAPDQAPHLIISTSVSFASKWLAPRLHRFKARHPDLNVNLDVTDVNVDLNEGQVDAGLRHGRGRYPDVTAARMLNETVTPVCSPDYLADTGGFAAPRGLARCTLLNEERRLANWKRWFAKAGLRKVTQNLTEITQIRSCGRCYGSWQRLHRGCQVFCVQDMRDFSTASLAAQCKEQERAARW
jgi:LysR family glycine cleavage system transcriptional activator